MDEHILSVDNYFDLKRRQRFERLRVWNALITDLTEKVATMDHHDSIYADYRRLEHERSAIMAIAGSKTLIVEQFKEYERRALRRIEELTNQKFR